MMEKLLCLMGFHDWNETGDYRTWVCNRCYKTRLEAAKGER